jgi:hypothetical protein
LSSAILYVAIVAIWAGVLIPRWLRRDSSAEEREHDEASPAGTETVPSTAPAPSADETAARPRPRPREDTAPSAERPARRPAPAARPAPDERPVPAERVAAAARTAASRPAPSTPSAERKKVLAARRRLLGMLLALALGSATLAVTKMAAWWVIVPPFVMLAGYTGLLREASKADAERRELARARAAEPAKAASSATSTAPATGAVPAAPVAPPAPPVPDAEVIKISASLTEGGEELYDQYADAKLRAVGDLPRPPPAGLRACGLAGLRACGMKPGFQCVLAR